MWLCLNNAFLSIVSKGCGPDELLVRSRRQGDIERVFPRAKVKKTVGNDYLYRAAVPREEIAETLARLVDCIHYSNFKNSVSDKKLAGAYGGVWSIMARLQEIPPYQRAPYSRDFFGDGFDDNELDDHMGEYY